MQDIQINLSEEDFKKALKSIIVHPNSKLIVDAIAGNLMQTSQGCSHLYKAMMGIEITPKFKVGDSVWIEETALPSWRMNIDKMKEDGKFFQGKLAGTIDQVNIYSSEMYTVMFIKYEAVSYAEKEDFYSIREAYLSKRDDDEIELM